MVTHKFLGGVLVLVSAILACVGGSGESSENNPTETKVLPIALQTSNARNTQAALISPTPRPPVPKSTSTNEPLVTPTNLTQGQAECDAEIFITSVTENSVENGMKVVVVTLGFKNTGTIWMYSRGPDGDWIVLQIDSPTYLTTKDGSNYEYSHYSDDTDMMTTEVLPPGFVTLGGAILGETLNYELRFEIPATQIPDSITIGNMWIECLATDIVRYPFLPDKTYNLPSDVTEGPAQKSSDQYPDLVGSILDLPKGVGRLEFTEVTRNEDTVTVTFNFTNFSSADVSPPFKGYIIGDSRLSTCLIKMEASCPVDIFDAVPPGQTQTFSTVFNILQNDTNLKFVYVYGDFEEPNMVYKINAKQ